VFAVIVSLQTRADDRKAFLAAAVANAESSTQEEPGCRRFDVVADDVDPSRVWLYELYDDEGAYTAHQQTAHYRIWRRAVEEYVIAGTQRVQRGTLAVPYAGRAALFTEARTANAFTDTPVPDRTLRAIWQLARWPPTANTQPLRVTFLRTDSGKARLLPLLDEGNRAKSASAPVVALLAADLDFHEFTPVTLPIAPGMRDALDALGREGREPMSRFNASLQIGYFLLAARAHGLAVGPMAGFDTDGVTAEFFPAGRHRALLVVNLGHPTAGAWHPRLPRLDTADVLEFR
jgi:3-hydroxypropanoate dehydrogenase